MAQRLGGYAARGILRVAVVIGICLILAALPLFTGRTGGGMDVSLARPAEAIGGYLVGIPSGTSFEFHAGFRERSLWEEGPRFLATSLVYAAVPAVLAVLLAVPLGGLLGRSPREWVQDVASGFGFLPDFLVIFGLQLGAVWITRATGHPVAKVATLTPSEPAVLLPLIGMTLVPMVYLARLISVNVRDLSSAEFVRLARARGVSASRIHWCHIMPHVLVAVRGNVPKITALVLTELFIVEYLFNLPGLTGFVLARAGDSGYQFPLVMNAFLGLSAVYLVTHRLLVGTLSGLNGLFGRV